MAIAVVLVGHSNWGKSKTLKALTNNVAQYRYWEIANKVFFIRRMSNDDFSEDLKKIIDSLSPQAQENVILTLCPDFDEPLKYTKSNLVTLSKKYKVFFFVLQHAYGRNCSVSPVEIEELAKYGKVKMFTEKDVEASSRAKALKEYIEYAVNGV
jgi:ATP-dependent RNA circularization protein (DNA/RNA ligase family)